MLQDNYLFSITVPSGGSLNSISEGEAYNWLDDNDILLETNVVPSDWIGDGNNLDHINTIIGFNRFLDPDNLPYTK